MFLIKVNNVHETVDAIVDLLARKRWNIDVFCTLQRWTVDKHMLHTRLNPLVE